MNGTFSLPARLLSSALPLLLTALCAAVAGRILLLSPLWIGVLAAACLCGAFAVARPFVALGAYVFVLAFLPRLRVVMGTQVIPIYIVDVLLTVCLAGVLARVLLHRWEWLRTPLDTSVALLMVATLPSFALMLLRYPYFAAETLYFLVRCLLHLGAFFAVTQLVRGPRELRQVLGIIWVGLALDGAWAILQSMPGLQPAGIYLTDLFNTLTQQRSSLPAAGEVRRAAAGFNMANDFAGFVAMFLPFALFGTWRPAMPHRFFMTVGSALAIAGFLLSFSRTAILALAASFVTCWLVTFPTQRTRRRVVLALALSAALCVGLASISDPVKETMVERGLGFVRPTDTPNVVARFVGHARFLAAVVEDPMMLLFGQNLRVIDLEQRDLLAEGTFTGFVSNSWLLVLLDLGIGAFCLYVFIYAGALRHVLRQLRSLSPSTPSHWLHLGAFASLVALFFTHAFDNYMAAMIFMKGAYFVVLGLCMNAHRLGSQPHRNDSFSPPARWTA